VTNVESEGLKTVATWAAIDIHTGQHNLSGQPGLARDQ
jgi:hypothetical protein